MAIYKLGDLLNISSGSTPRKEKRLWKDEILWYTPIDLREKTHTIRKISKANNKKWIPKNTVLISSRAPIGYVGIAKNTCWHSQGIKGFLNNEKSIINKYLYYWVISNRRTFISNGIGTTFKEISSSIIKSIQGFFPSLKTQKQIIDIIEPVENLFLKYSNCVRIDTFENTKKDLKALIDIIEPVERLIFLTKSIIKIITKWYANKQIMEAKNKKIKDICLNSSNGFPYQKKHIDVKGIYKIFTIKNIKNSKNFSRTNFICNNKILVGDVVTGLSGTIGTTKIMDCDKWASNQRTLTINSKYFLEIKSIIEINMLKLLKIARGAAQKNISHFEILDLDISIKNYNHNISNTYLIMWRIVNLAKKIKKSLIELLIK